MFTNVLVGTVQITHNLNGPRVSHAYDTRVTRVLHDTRGVNHTRVGFLGSTRVYTHTQYLHTHAYAHAVFTFACVFTRVHACMANVPSILASYLSTSIYNATVLVTLFFPYRTLAACQQVKEEIAEEVESTSLIL